MTTPVDAGTERSIGAERLRMFVQPILVLVAGAAVVFWAFDRDLTATQSENINAANVALLIWQHLLITVDGETAPECRDIAIPDGALAYSTGHQVSVAYRTDGGTA